MANLTRKFPVPLILKKILNDNLSGDLLIKENHSIKELFFIKGELQFAKSNQKQDGLCKILYNKKIIKQNQYFMLHKMSRDNHKSPEKSLIESQMVDQSTLLEIKREQLQQIVLSIFSITSGEWTFRLGKPQMPRKLKINLELPEIIIKGCQNILDFSYYKKRFNHRAPITIPIPESMGQYLSPDHIRFYVKLTKCNFIASKQILSLMDIPEEQFWQQIIMLYLLNIIDFTEFRIDRQLNKDIEMIAYLHDRLKANSIDHYELLSLKDTASVNDVSDRYFNFSKQYNPSALHVPPDSKTEKKAEFILEKAQEAYNILSDERKKKAYDTGNQKKITLESFNIKKEKILKSRKLYLEAHSLYEQNKFQDATRILEEAIGLDSERTSYFLLLGICQSRIPSLRPNAEKNLLVAIEKEPWNADPLFYLGQLYWLENMFKKAEKYFRKALEINMEHTLASKMIKKIEKNSKLKKPFFSVFKKS